MRGVAVLVRARPRPFDVLAIAFLALFLGFLAGGLQGLVIGVAVGLGTWVVGALRPGLERWTWAVALVGLALAMPVIVSGDYRLSQLATAGYTALAVLGLNILTGYTGQPSVGHSAFMGMGAYGTAVALREWDIPFIAAMAFGVGVTMLAGLVTGVAGLNLRGPYLAIVTLGLGVIFSPLLKLEELREWTGGAVGLNMFQHTFMPPVDWGWLTETRWYYYLTLFCLLGGLILAYNMLNSGLGRAFKAVREDELAAAVMGVNVRRTKVVAFVISAAYAGVAGVLLFLIGNRFLSPETFTLLLAIELLVGVILGGPASITGSLLGAFILVYLYREGLETLATQTEAGSNTWLLLFGALAAGAFLLFHPLGQRWTQRLAEALGLVTPLLLLALRALLALAGGIAFTALARLATEELLELVTLRGAIAGAFLIVAVLAMPYGVAGLLAYLQYLSWHDLQAAIRGVISVPAREVPGAPAPSAGGNPHRGDGPSAHR